MINEFIPFPGEKRRNRTVIKKVFHLNVSGEIDAVYITRELSYLCKDAAVVAQEMPSVHFCLIGQCIYFGACKVWRTNICCEHDHLCVRNVQIDLPFFNSCWHLLETFQSYEWMFKNISALHTLFPLIFFSQHPLLAQSFYMKVEVLQEFFIGFSCCWQQISPTSSTRLNLTVAWLIYFITAEMHESFQQFTFLLFK